MRRDSTALRLEPATRLIGIEPAAGMRAIACQRTSALSNVTSLDGRFAALPRGDESGGHLYSIHAFSRAAGKESGGRAVVLPESIFRDFPIRYSTWPGLPRDGIGVAFNGGGCFERGSLFRGRPSFSSVSPLRRYPPAPCGRRVPAPGGAGARVSTCGRSDVLVGETRRSRRREPPQAFDARARLRVGRVDGGRFVRGSVLRKRRTPTEGGEALAVAEVEIFGARAGTAVLPAGAGAWAITRRAPWHVVWTHSHCEQLVCDQLTAKGFHPFVPSMGAWSTRAGRRRLISVPMFPGYVFLNDALDKVAHVEARMARGVVGILGEGWERPAQVPEEEIQAIRRVVDARLPTLPHPYLTEGRRVRIAAGPLVGLEGILVKAHPARGLLVLSVNLLQRSVIVEVDWTDVMPV